MNDNRVNKIIDSINNADINVANEETLEQMQNDAVMRKAAKMEVKLWYVKDRKRYTAYKLFCEQINKQQAYLITRDCSNEQIKTLTDGE